MKKNIQLVKTSYFNEMGRELEKPEGCSLVIISVFIDKDMDQHHIQFSPFVSRFELSGLLLNLAQRLSKEA